MRTFTKLTIAVLAVVGLGFTAVSMASDSQAGAQAAGKTITIKDFQYSPADLAVKVGEQITVTNSDIAPHTVTARDGSFDSSDRGLMAEGDQFRWRFRVPGTYAYFCRVHQSRGMVGEIVVVDPAAPTTATTRPTSWAKRAGASGSRSRTGPSRGATRTRNSTP